jgi:hypothetical protein
MTNSLTRFVTSHGRRIEVETLPCKAKSSKTRQREAELFVKVPLAWASTAAKAIGSHQSFVVIWILHLAWRTRSQTVTLSNTALAKYRINREAKRRALVKLEAAGLVKLKRLHGRPTIVTVLDQG